MVAITFSRCQTIKRKNKYTEINQRIRKMLETREKVTGNYKCENSDNTGE